MLSVSTMVCYTCNHSDKSQHLQDVGEECIMYLRQRSKAGLRRLGMIAGLVAVLFGYTAVPSFAQQEPAVKNASNVTPQALSETFSEIVKKVEPAVVSISTKGKMPDITAKGDAPKGEPGDIMDFFRRQLPRRPIYAIGSGFIVDKTG
jgi:S1-C subfamily serine protease